MRDDEQKNHRLVPAVTRAIAILRLLGRSEAPMGINQIARELDLVPSTCLHILRVLAHEGLVNFDTGTKRYEVGLGLLTMARSVISKNDFAAVAQPHLTELSTRFELTTIATQMAGRLMVVVALSQALLPFRLQVDLGSRFPALISASGRCYAAFNGLSEDEMREGFAALRWDNPPRFEEWREQVRQTYEVGFGVDVEQYIAGVTIVSVPLRDRAGHMTHALVAAGISERLGDGGAAAVAEEMRKVRDGIEDVLVVSSPVPARGRSRKVA